MEVIHEGPPRIVEHAGTTYYHDGRLLVPVAACSCDAYNDPWCRVPAHRRRGRANSQTEGPGNRRWLERRHRAQFAGPVLICGQSEAIGSP